MMDFTSNQPHFTQINEDCLCKVFDWVSLGDLCALHRTSKILQQSVENVFRRKYQHLVLQSITIKCENAIQFFEEEDYVRCFSKQITNIQIDFADCEILNKPLDTFIKNNCCMDIKNIIFCGRKWASCLNSMKNVLDILQSVETIAFNITIIENVNLMDIISNSPQLKNISTNVRNMNLDHVIYPQLEQFQTKISYDINELDFKTLEIFFRQNPRIQRFVCSIHVINIQSLKNLIKLVSRTAIKELFIDFIVVVKINFTLIRDELQSLKVLQHFERLELALFSHLILNEFELTSLKCFSGLHLRHYNCLYNLEDHIDTMKSFHYLRVFHIDSYVNEILGEKLSVQLSTNLKNLEELYLDGPKPPKQLIHSFILNARKLTKLYILSKINNFDFEELNLPSLIDNRVKDAQRLYVFINMNNINVHKNIKPVNVQHVNNNLTCENPLINFKIVNYK